jgi:DNA-directed RNA polymerase specialized sigma24 family protein
MRATPCRKPSSTRFAPWRALTSPGGSIRGSIPCCGTAASGSQESAGTARPWTWKRSFWRTPRGVSIEETIALDLALRQLSPEDCEIVTLRHLDGLSYQELAQRLDIPPGTVMSRLFYARRRLRDLLGRPEEEK